MQVMLQVAELPQLTVQPPPAQDVVHSDDVLQEILQLPPAQPIRQSDDVLHVIVELPPGQSKS